jgi:hypothetical protein
MVVVVFCCHATLLSLFPIFVHPVFRLYVHTSVKVLLRRRRQEQAGGLFFPSLQAGLYVARNPGLKANQTRRVSHNNSIQRVANGYL